LFTCASISGAGKQRETKKRSAMPSYDAGEGSAEVAVILVGLHQKIGGPWMLVYVFRRLRCIHIYEYASMMYAVRKNAYDATTTLRQWKRVKAIAS
jgi:hypothetical protein